MTPGPAITEKYADPSLPPTHGAPVAVLSWTDAAGVHEQTITSATTIGTSRAATIVLDDPFVSRIHVELTPTPEGLDVQDLRSTNGTFCDGNRIRSGTFARGFRLRVGRIEMDVRLPAATVEAPLHPHARFANLVGRSVAMRSLFEQLARVAPSDETVMLHGESGTGKELVASAIHLNSKRARKPYIVVDCTLLHPNLVESELFGHVKGSYSGATRDREGQFEAADGGTIFLDEIGELPLEMQAKLLRVLETGEIRRLGETEHRKVNVRVVTASHRDLREMVNQRTFREDLFYRLAVIKVRVPALRDRLDDVPLLVAHFVEQITGMQMPSEEVLVRLGEMAWDGNVRQLRALVRSANVLGWGAAIAEQQLSSTSLAPPPPSVPPPAAREGAGPGPSVEESDDELSPIGGTYYDARRRWVAKGERVYIKWQLDRHGGNTLATAASAGIDVSTLRKILKRLRDEGVI